jgi:phosphate transport system protein
MTRNVLDQNIDALLNELLVLESMVREAALKAVDALAHRDLELSREVYANDRWINEKRWKIEESCIAEIATQQPLASDLRVLASILEVAGELERMGDYAKGIARVNMMLRDGPLPPITDDLRRMAEQATRMLEASVKALVERDAEAAQRIPDQDDEVDELFNEVYHKLVQGMIADPETIDHANHLQWAAHNLERMADRVTNICERAIFVASGELTELDHSDDEWRQVPS